MIPLDPGLYAAVLTEPESDLPRLVAADWWEEQGEDSRASLIRTQIELSKPAPCEWEVTDGMPCPQYNAKRSTYRVNVWCPTCAKREKLKAAERRLLESHGADWFRSDRGMVEGSPFERNAWHYRPLPSMHPYRYWLGYKRGFLGAFDGPLADWLSHGMELARLYPVEVVSLSDREPWSNSTFASWDNPVGWEQSRIWQVEGWRYMLAPAVFDLLDPPETHTRGGNPVACFPSKEAAVAALSRACLAWARS